MIFAMSALCQKQTSRHLQPLSALPPKADIAERDRNVRFVPKADIDRVTGDFGVELLFFNKRGKLDRAVVQDFDAGLVPRMPIVPTGVATFMLPDSEIAPAMKVNVPFVRLIRLELK